MTQNTISACDLVMNFSAFVNKVTISADQSGFSRSRLTRNLGYFPSNLRSENALNNVEFSAMRNSKLRSRILASAFPSEEGKSKLSSSFDSQLFDRNEVGSERVHIEEVSSFSYSRPDLLKNDNRPLTEAELLDKLKAIRLHVLASEQWNSSRIGSCHRTYSASAKNLIHYEALQGLNIEQVKEELSLTDLMNWDIDNSCVLASLEACIRLLESSSLNSTNVKEKVSVSYSEKLTVSSARNKAFSNARSLLGPLEEEKTSHVMVTIGSEAIENERLLDDLVNNGASIVRINCAHGDPSEWSEIIRRVRTSSQMAEKPCRVLMDLAGPKLRTGKLSPGPNVVKVSPKRDAFGNVSSPAQVWLSHRGAGPAPIHVTLDASFVIDGPDFLTQLGVGNTVGFKDARGKKRAFKISKKFHVFSGVGLVAECTETSYVESGTKLRFDKKKREFHFGIVVDVPASEQFLRVRVGDLLIISRERSAESLCSVGDDAHRITCPSSLLFDSVRPGQPISFDDGKIEGTIEGAGASEIVVSIRHAKPGKGTKLGAEKSINVPESDILFQGLSSKDLLDLEFVASQADMVGVSFLRGVDDIIALHRELENRRISGSLGIVLKIETRSGFDNLSEMIMEAMKCPNPLGVMIARGDLAVECGWERLAGIQQEILSICKAAHIPVIWATQVLETFLKSGVPTRAEITDASTGRRANCVMLNKGRHVVEAVSFLGTMLRKS